MRIAGSRSVLRAANPFFRGETGKRRRGWNAFFDFPPSHPEGTRRFQGKLSLRSAKARTLGGRVEIYFDGLRMGPFDGGLAYTFFPGSRLVHQEAVLTTYQANTAYYYDAGIEFASPADRRPGGNMHSEFFYYDTEGELRRVVENGFQPERTPMKVRYRALAVNAGQGSVAVFPEFSCPFPPVEADGANR